MATIKGSNIEELTMVDLEQQKDTLKILSERNYIKCLKLDLEANDPYMEYECEDEDRLYDDINEIAVHLYKNNVFFWLEQIAFIIKNLPISF